MERSIFGELAEKMPWLTKNPLIFLSLPNKPKFYFLSFFSILPIPTKRGLTFSGTLSLWSLDPPQKKKRKKTM